MIWLVGGGGGAGDQLVQNNCGPNAWQERKGARNEILWAQELSSHQDS